MLLFSEPVSDAKKFDCRRPHVGRSTDGDHSHVSAIGAAGNADLRRIDIAGGGKEMRGVDFILQIAAAEIFVIRPLKFHSVAGRAANIGRNANVAARRESGSGLVETVYRLPRGTAVRKQDPGVGSFTFEIERHPEKRADRLSVKCLVVH